MSDSSDSERPVKKVSKKHDKKSAPVAAPSTEEFMIKPEKGVATVDTANWPLLLKVNFNPLPLITLRPPVTIN